MVLHMWDNLSSHWCQEGLLHYSPIWRVGYYIMGVCQKTSTSSKWGTTITIEFIEGSHKNKLGVEIYRHEILSKFYNLRQRNKNILTYYDEFQQFVLNIEYHENMEHVVIHFKVGLNKEISSVMTIHMFDTIEDIFQATLDVETDLKKRYLSIPKGNHPLILG